MDGTIVAIASPPGGAYRGIVRLSGPDVSACLRACFQADDDVHLDAITIPTAIEGSVALDGISARLPCEVYLWPTRRSFTGQPTAEFHTIGSPPLLDALLRTLCHAGARLAQPGEFTLRAFLTGRLDLTQAEAVLGVIDAADPGQLHTALAQLAGGLAAPLADLRDSLLELLAHLEAGFDFADEDLPFLRADDLRRQIDDAARRTDALARQVESRAEQGELVRVALTGWPNTGKSRLFNALLGRAAAIVSEHPGTTRDYLTAPCDLGGVHCLLVDTAGVEPDAANDIDQAAQSAAAQQSRQAQVRVLCLDSTRPMNDWEQEQLAAGPGESLLVLTKVDSPRATDCPWPAIPTSAATGEGLTTLRARLRETLATVGIPGGEVVASTAVRCRESLRRAADHLARAAEVLTHGEELVAAELRMALDELGQVAGKVYTDDLLDRVFSRFCVGK